MATRWITATVAAVACVTAVAAAPAKMKGVRAVIAHGGVLEEAVTIDDSAVATSLVRALLNAEDYTGAALGSRPCMELAVFLPNQSTAYLTNAQLNVRQADYSMLLYPAAGGAPAAAWVNGRIVVVPANQLKSLTSVSIPISVAADAPSC